MGGPTCRFAQLAQPGWHFTTRSGELDTLVFEAMQSAEIAWKLLDDANLDYYKRLEAHEEAQQPDDGADQ